MVGVDSEDGTLETGLDCKIRGTGLELRMLETDSGEIGLEVWQLETNLEETDSEV